MASGNIPYQERNIEPPYPPKEGGTLKNMTSGTRLGLERVITRHERRGRVTPFIPNSNVPLSPYLLSLINNENPILKDGRVLHKPTKPTCTPQGRRGREIPTRKTPKTTIGKSKQNDQDETKQQQKRTRGTPITPKSEMRQKPDESPPPRKGTTQTPHKKKRTEKTKGTDPEGPKKKKK